jgi:hypothetical protein
MARITVHPVGRRNIDAPHCAICGTKRTLGFGVCANMCHWLIPGWVAYNAVLKEITFVDHRALPLAELHKWNPKTKRVSAPSFPKLCAAARALGWDGDTAGDSQPTFVEAIRA